MITVLNQFHRKQLDINSNDCVDRFSLKGSEKRISALSLFKSGILPAYEDAANKHGAEYQIRVENLNNMELFNKKWEELVLALVSGELPNTEKVTGIRCVDRSRAGSE